MKANWGKRFQVAWDALIRGKTVVNVPVTVNVNLFVDGRKLGGYIKSEHLAFICENVESAVVRCLQDELMPKAKADEEAQVAGGGSPDGGKAHDQLVGAV